MSQPRFPETCTPSSHKLVSTCDLEADKYVPVFFQNSTGTYPVPGLLLNSRCESTEGINRTGLEAVYNQHALFLWKILMKNPLGVKISFSSLRKIQRYIFI